MPLDPHIESGLEVVEIPSTLQDAKGPEEAILARVRECGYCEDAVFAIKLALEEALTNAVKHGNCNDPTKRVIIRYYVGPDQTVILVRDQGCGFELKKVPDPTRPDRLGLPNGRGIMLMRAYLNEVFYQAGGREVCMIKRNE